MDDVARLPAKDRADIFTAAAAERRIRPAILEKDFWVCWVLKRLFTLKDPPAGLLFKGGTSLSKAYNAIQRFSEDVDLSFDRAALGFAGAADPSQAPSRKKRDAALDSLSQAVRDLVRDDYLTQLKDEFAQALGSEEGEAWVLGIAKDAEDGQTLLFDYPKHEQKRNAFDYITDTVRLEFGARSAHWPTVERSVTPYAAETHARFFKNPACVVKVLAGERTFWEKATILHMWHHIKKDRTLPSRQSRHYYDLVILSEHEIGRNALADPSMLETVAQHKAVFFHAGWAHYHTARPGSLRLVPKPERLGELAKDYKRMRAEMFFDVPPDFDTLVNKLREIENAINGGAAPTYP